MIDRLSWIFIFSILILSSCQGQTTSGKNIDTSQTVPPSANQEPNYNYIVEAPEGWTIRDTTMQDGLRIRLLLPPQSLQPDYPAGNVIIASMQGRNLDDFTTRNINYLKDNLPGTVILDRGTIDSAAVKGQWFTYTLLYSGSVREMINYIIPLNGFAYMITCGSNKGSFNKYREAFDRIANSFKG